MDVSKPNHPWKSAQIKTPNGVKGTVIAVYEGALMARLDNGRIVRLSTNGPPTKEEYERSTRLRKQERA